MSQELHLVPSGGDPPDNGNRGECLWCHKPTLVATLNHYGARCFACYEAYCCAPQTSPSLLGWTSSHDPQGWARLLRKRDESGERLTVFQRFAWRAAVGPDRYIEEADA